MLGAKSAYKKESFDIDSIVIKQCVKKGAISVKIHFNKKLSGQVARYITENLHTEYLLVLT